MGVDSDKYRSNQTIHCAASSGLVISIRAQIDHLEMLYTQRKTAPQRIPKTKCTNIMIVAADNIFVIVVSLQLTSKVGVQVKAIKLKSTNALKSTILTLMLHHSPYPKIFYHENITNIHITLPIFIGNEAYYATF